MNQKTNDKLTTIARNILLLNHLETTNSGADFSEIAVWSLKEALEAAYVQGAADALAITETEVAKSTGWMPAGVEGFIERIRNKLGL